MRDESMDIEGDDMCVFPLDQRPLRQPTIEEDDPGRTGRNQAAPPRIPVEENYRKPTAMNDERTEYSAPNITLLTVKEAVAVWSKEDRQELYEHLNRVYQVRMR
jgi:hypothetical protein